MLYVTIIFISIFLFQSFSLFDSYYPSDLDQFMYFGSRLINKELVWIKEFDDKSPFIQFLFSIPAYFNNINLWLFISIFFSLITSYLLSLIIKTLNKDIFKKSSRDLNQIAFFTSSFYLFLILYFSVMNINIFTANLLISSIFFQIKSHKALNQNKKSWIIYLCIAALCAAMSISIRPYLFFACVFNSIWLSLRDQKVNIGNIKFVLSNISKTLILWILLILLFIFSINVIPYLVTNNLLILVNSIKLNSIEYGNSSLFATLKQQFYLFQRNFELLFILFITLLIFFISIIKKRKKLNQLINNKEIKPRKFFIDIIYIGLVAPLSIEILIVIRHFFMEYLFLFSPYFCIALSILLTLCFNIYNKNILIKIIYLGLTLIFIVSKNIIFIDANNIKSINMQKKINDSNIISTIIISERNNNNKIGFLFPFNNYYHWKFNESRQGFPLEAVLKYITKGEFDKVLDAYPDLKYKFLLPRKNQVCMTLDNFGPELIFIDDNQEDHNTFVINCLRNSANYYIDTSYNNLNNSNYLLFRNSITKKKPISINNLIIDKNKTR